MVQELPRLQPILISRGDTQQIDIAVTSGVLGENERIVFGVRKTLDNSSPMLIKKFITLDKLSFTISRQDSLLDAGSYYYDFRLIEADGVVTTLCRPSDFIILGVATNV